MKTTLQKVDEYSSAIKSMKMARMQLGRIERDNSNASLIEMAIGDITEAIKVCDRLRRELRYGPNEEPV